MAAFPYYTAIVLLWLLCSIILLNSITGSMKTHCNKHDLSTLLNFKQGVTDPSGILSSWIREEDCCQWRGVQCDNTTGRVIELSLPCHTILPDYGGDKEDKSHCLTGELDLSLLEIEFLSYLNLSNNDFKIIQINYSVRDKTCNDLSRGTPLHLCGNSSNLHHLDLSKNYDLLIDNLSWISHIFSLQYLDLSVIDLHKETGWLQLMTLLPSLSELYLESCQLQNIYPSLQYANFTSLKVLNLAANDFISELPNWLFNLSCGISHIDLHQSHIHGQLPKALLNLRSIKALHLSKNNLEGPMPHWLGQLEQLQLLDLSHNSFSGPIPTGLGNLSSLIALELHHNNLDGNLPESLGQLFNLEDFAINDNFFTGNISGRNFHSLANLKSIYIASPALIFDFDHEWIPSFQLQVLWLGYVGPKFPSWIYTQSSLRVLSIWDSRASFEPLDKFWRFAAKLELLDLSNNSVNADMSNVLLNSKVVLLEDNNLKGGVPQLSPNVTILKLAGNTLSGSISPLLCQKKIKIKTNLESLEISSNDLSGEIPNCWKDWKSLLRVDFRNNNFIGKIPHSIGSLYNLISLNVEDNKLSGEVPLSLKNCKKLWVLNLGENMFSGAVPSWMGQSVKALILRSNQFSGDIPTEICQLHSLKALDLANNRLLGLIPNCLQNMTSMVSKYASFEKLFIRVTAANHAITYIFSLTLLTKGNKLKYSSLMYVIDLSSNNLSGIVPSAMFTLTTLQSLNLSHNQLMGTIPQEIGNLTQLESLDLSCNQFSGQIPQSMSTLSFLGTLNLSFNDFMGKIPSGTQLQGFTNLSYMGNPKLCGPPLTKICTQGGNLYKDDADGEESDDDEVHSWFFMGLGIGFATGFWGVLGVIFFNKRCRHAYFRFFSQLHDMMLLKIDFSCWKLRSCFIDN